MNPARIAVLAIAVVAGGIAAYLASGSDEKPAPAPVAQLQTVDVLVAKGDIGLGQAVKSDDLQWQTWPAATASGTFIKRTDRPEATKQIAGMIARSPFIAGEPIREPKLIKADGSGFMAAILPTGMRAVSTEISAETAAGGFILPNDRVDIIRTFRDDESSRAGGVDVHMSETILTNIRVLAIGQNIQERNGEKVVTGETATLELTPAQAEMITLAQKIGHLSLALRSLADANQTQDAPRSDRAESALTVVRYGVAKQSPKR
ncbi:MAG: Flp pilus assembly protein CpaB [Microvirga sp.]